MLFENPYNVETSLQLSSKLANGDPFHFLDQIQDADHFFKSKKFKKGFYVLQPLFDQFQEFEVRKIKNTIRYNCRYLVAHTPVLEEFGFIKDHLKVKQDRQFQGKDLNRVIKKKKLIFNRLYGADLSVTNISFRDTDASFEINAPTDEDTFLHLDAKKGLTTIIYLNQANEMNGAFRYMKDSETFPLSVTLKSFQEIVHSKVREQNLDVKNLPPEIRMSQNVFKDLEPEKQTVILDNIVWVNGGPGTAITFCGNRLLHGGGKPVKGKRSSMFIQHKGLIIQRIAPWI